MDTLETIIFSGLLIVLLALLMNVVVMMAV